MTLEFRLIEIEKRNPFLIAAMDHAIFEECESGHSPPTVVYHNWEKAVSLANSQSIDDLNLEACKEQGFDIVRLTTGGKAVVHFPDTEFSYSLFVPITERNPRATYELYCGRIATALQRLDVPSAVVDNNDIFVRGKKIGGNAQHIKQRYAMQQGVILYQKPDAKLMLSLMNPSLYAEHAEEKLANILTGFREYSRATQEQVRKTLTTSLLSGYTLRKGILTEREQARIESLLEQYRNPFDAQATQVRGLCWLPALAYVKAKAQMEARV